MLTVTDKTHVDIHVRQSGLLNERGDVFAEQMHDKILVSADAVPAVVDALRRVGRGHLEHGGRAVSSTYFADVHVIGERNDVVKLQQGTDTVVVSRSNASDLADALCAAAGLESDRGHDDGSDSDGDDGVVLRLSRDEALALAAVLDCVGGPPGRSWRRHTDAVYDRLRRTFSANAVHRVSDFLTDDAPQALRWREAEPTGVAACHDGKETQR